VKAQQWFGIIILFTVLTMLVVYAVPVDSVFVAVRWVFGFAFVVSMPGYCLVNVLFTGKNKLDIIEETVLSVALSFGVAGIAGLFLGLSPIGITFEPITISLTAIVLVLAAVAFLRKLKLEKNAAATPEQAEK
jgi:uncharacterized membrane protein